MSKMAFTPWGLVSGAGKRTEHPAVRAAWIHVALAAEA